MVLVRDVARGEDVRVAGDALLVRQDAVVDVEARGDGEVDDRLDAHAGDDRVALDDRALGRDHALHAPVALEPVDVLAHVEDDAVVLVDGLEDGAHLGPEDALERTAEDLDDLDRRAHGAQGRGDLHPDESGADDRDPAAGRRRLADAVGVLDRPELEDALQVAAGQRERRFLPPVASSSRS